MATDLRPRPTAGRPPRPSSAGAPAARVLVTMLLGLGLAALVNADALVERAERKPFGEGRDRSLAIWHPVQDVAHISQLHRIRAGFDRAAGNEDRGGDIIASTPEDDEEVAEPATPPHVRQPSAADPLRVHVAGDSIVHDAGNAFLEVAAADPLLRPTLHYENATGLTRPDFYDWPAALVDDMATHRPDVVFVLFGGNDAQGLETPTGEVFQRVAEPGWQQEYGRRVGAVMDLLRAEDRIIVWIGLPPMREAGFDGRAATMSEIYRAQAEERPWVRFLDTVPVLGDAEGNYVEAKPGPSGATEDLRQDDGVHLSAAGARWVAEAMAAQVRALVAEGAEATTTTAAP